MMARKIAMATMGLVLATAAPAYSRFQPPYPYDTVDGPAAPFQVHEYARIATEMTACHVRPQAWGDKIFAILKTSIPIGRDDLRQAMADGIHDARVQIDFTLPADFKEFCNDFLGRDHWERVGDGLVYGCWTVWNGNTTGATLGDGPPPMLLTGTDQPKCSGNQQ
jgi:hypothetical protein